MIAAAMEWFERDLSQTFWVDPEHCPVEIRYLQTVVTVVERGLLSSLVECGGVRFQVRNRHLQTWAPTDAFDFRGMQRERDRQEKLRRQLEQSGATMPSYDSDPNAHAVADAGGNPPVVLP